MKTVLISLSAIVITVWGYTKVSTYFNGVKQQIDLTVRQIDSVKVQRDSARMVVDSLSTEIQNAVMSTTRYEIALDRLREADSIAAKKFDSLLSNIE